MGVIHSNGSIGAIHGNGSIGAIHGNASIGRRSASVATRWTH